MTRVLFLLCMLPGFASAAVPSWCAMLAPESAFYQANCVEKPPIASPPSGGMVCEASQAETLTFNGFCAGWTAYRKDNTLRIVCPGQPAPAGWAKMWNFGP